MGCCLIPAYTFRNGENYPSITHNDLCLCLNHPPPPFPFPHHLHTQVVQATDMLHIAPLFLLCTSVLAGNLFGGGASLSGAGSADSAAGGEPPAGDDDEANECAAQRWADDSREASEARRLRAALLRCFIGALEAAPLAETLKARSAIP